MDKLKLYFDGASRNNPGKAGAGVVLIDSDDKIIAKKHKFLGEKTNNQAEYLAVLLGLDLISDLEDKPEEIEFIGDSQLVVNQLKGEYKIKSDNLKELYWQIRKRLLESGFDFSFKHIKRSKNKLADKLANKAIDEENSRN